MAEEYRDDYKCPGTVRVYKGDTEIYVACGEWVESGLYMSIEDAGHLLSALTEAIGVAIRNAEERR